MPTDWTSYEQDVIRFYVDGNKTTSATIDWLRETHRVNVTPKQFKIKFGGLKNLRDAEWKAVIQEIRKRKAKGKGSDVYLHGRKLNWERIMRRMRRNLKESAAANSTEFSTVDIGIDTYRQHRIEIRTPLAPAPHSSSPRRLNRLPLKQTTYDLSLMIPGSCDSQANSSDSSGDCTKPFPNTRTCEGKSRACSAPSFTEGVIGGSDLETECTSSMASAEAWYENQLLPIQEPTLAMHAPIDVLGLSGSSICFFWDLPAVSSIAIDSMAYAPAFSGTDLLFKEAIEQGRCRWGSKGCVFSHLISAEPKLRNLKSAADFVEKTLCIVMENEQSAGDEAPAVTDRDYIRQVFSIVAYLCSNNLLSTYELQCFIEYLLRSGAPTLLELIEFLQIQSPNIRALTVAILRCIITHNNIRFHKLLSAEVKFNFLDRLMSANHLAVSGRLGGELLLGVVIRNDLDMVKLLVAHGADVNYMGESKNRYINHKLITPVTQSIIDRNYRITGCLVHSGADVNKRIKLEDGEGEENALSIAIESNNLDAVSILLDAGAEVDPEMTTRGYTLLELAMKQSRTMYKALCDKMPSSAIPKLCQLVQAAEKGNNTLAQFLHEHGIVEQQVLEQSLCQAVKVRNLGAVRTLLKRGIDPNAQRARSNHAYIGDNIDDVEDTRPLVLAFIHQATIFWVSSDIVYLLLSAGAEVNENILARCRHHMGGHTPHILAPFFESKYAGAVSIVGPSLLEYNASIGFMRPCGIILDKGVCIDTYGSHGLSALQAAAGGGSLGLTQFLLDQGADANLAASDNQGLTALQAAALSGSMDVVDYLVEAGADVAAPPAKHDGLTVLEATAEASPLSNPSEQRADTATTQELEDGVISIFKKLLALGAPVNRTDSADGTLLHRLIRSSRLECLRLALAAGARLEDRECPQVPPMKGLRYWLRSGVSLQQEPRQGNYTPLQVASGGKEIEVVQLLLDHGAKVNAPAGDEFGRTALQAATSAVSPDPKIIELLLHHGADVNAPPSRKGGLTAFQGAAISGNFHIVTMLRAYGADVNAPVAPEDGRTALQGAAEHGRLEMIKLLLLYGAKVDEVNGFAREIQLAEKNGHLAVVDYLQEQWKALLKESCEMSSSQSWDLGGMVFPQF